MRKHYIDNLRWIDVLLLIPYHAAMAWNVWDETNYINFNGSKILSSFVVFFSPFFMPLLFLLAGISTKFALNKRSYKNYIYERIKRLILPMIVGTLTIMPIMSFLADKYHNGYSGNYFTHYKVFFSKMGVTAFSIGQFWFLIYLFFISIIAIFIIALQKKVLPNTNIKLKLWLVIILGLPLPLFNKLLSIDGKSLIEFTYIFILGYYVFSSDEIVNKLEKYRVLFIIIGLIFSGLDVYLYIWSTKNLNMLNIIAKFVAEWFMILGLIGIAKKHIDFSNGITNYMSKRSFLFFSFHFISLIIMQYIFAKFISNIVILYLIPVILSYLLSFILIEICIRIPVICYLFGSKPIKNDKKDLNTLKANNN